MRAFLGLVAGTLILAACHQQPADPVASGAWVRLPAVSGRPGAAYFTLKGGTRADTLLSVSTPAALRSELHETMSHEGRMSMQPIKDVPLPAGGTLAFAFIRVLGPNGMVDILLNAVDLPKIRTPYLTPWGPVIGLVWDNIPLTVLILLAGLGSVANQSVEAARDVGANALQVFWHIILPRISNSILVALSFSVLGIFSSFTLPYLLGPASPEMLGPFMQRTLREVQDPIGAMTQAVIAFGFCIAFGLFYVRSVARNQGK